MPAAPLRPRVTVDLAHSYKQWLDDEFDQETALHVTEDLSAPVEYVHHAHVYWAASVDRRPPRAQNYMTVDRPTERTVGQMAALLAATCTAIVLGIWGIDDVIPYLVEVVR